MPDTVPCPKGDNPDRRSWFFDVSTASCRVSPTSGCDVTDDVGNRFYTLDECISTCLPGERAPHWFVSVVVADAGRNEGGRHWGRVNSNEDITSNMVPSFLLFWIRHASVVHIYAVMRLVFPIRSVFSGWFHFRLPLLLHLRLVFDILRRFPSQMLCKHSSLSLVCAHPPEYRHEIMCW